MLITSIMFLLLSNAVTLRRDKSILFSRVAILVLLYSFILALNTLYITNLNRGIGLFGGLFHATSTIPIFHICIFLIRAAILQLSGFTPPPEGFEFQNILHYVHYFYIIYGII